MENSPFHYKMWDEKAEVSDIDEVFLQWCLKSHENAPLTPIEYFYTGNIFKYLWRYPFKNSTLSDLKKARHYLDQVIALHGG